MAMVNIPRDVEDDFYRYKMPVLRAKVEGRGNGIKTLVENMSDIAKALDRKPDYPTKFFGFELGALTKVEAQADRYIVNGKHEAADLAKVLDNFIEKYVLCGNCRNPETDMRINKSGVILLKCRACGAISPCDSSHRLSTYIIKNPPDNVKAAAEAKELQKKEAKKKALLDDQEEADDEDWAVPTTPEAVNARRLLLLGTKDRLSKGGADEATATDAEAPSTEEASGAAAASKRLADSVPLGGNPIEAFKAFFAANPSNDEALAQLKDFSDVHKLSETKFLTALFAALFEPDPKKDFVLKARYLKLFVPTSKQQKVVLFCVEKLIQMNSALLSLVPSLLNGLWEESIIDEEVVFKWFKNPMKQLPPKLSAAVRKNAEPFVKWLETAEEEEEDSF